MANCIMMHNPKVAGTYLLKLLNRNGISHHRCSHNNVKTVKRVLGMRTWKRCFKFAFVRNPWDRLASWYFFHTKLFQTMDFPGFVDIVCSGDLPAIQEAVMFTNKPFWMHSIKLGMVNPLFQLQYTDGVDFIGKYENIKQDVKVLMRKLGKPNFIQIEPKNVSKFKKGGYHQYYTDEMRDKVANLFANDIKAFNYTF